MKYLLMLLLPLQVLAADNVVTVTCYYPDGTVKFKEPVDTLEFRNSGLNLDDKTIVNKLDNSVLLIRNYDKNKETLTIRNCSGYFTVEKQ